MTIFTEFNVENLGRLIGSTITGVEWTGMATHFETDIGSVQFHDISQLCDVEQVYVRFKQKKISRAFIFMDIKNLVGATFTEFKIQDSELVFETDQWSLHMPGLQQALKNRHSNFNVHIYNSHERFLIAA